MRRFKNKAIRPRKVFDKARIAEEKEIKKKYGLKNMREIWIAEAIVKNIRARAKQLITATPEEQRDFILSLARKGFVSENASLDDVLALDKTKILDRRLQTVVYKKGLAKTIKHARQLIVHGHIALNNAKINSPGYLVRIDEENNITLIQKPKPVPASEAPALEVSAAQATPQLNEINE